MGSKSNISVLAISGKSRNRKIIAPSPHFIINPPPLYGIVPIVPEGHFIMTIPPPHFKIFFRNTPPNCFNASYIFQTRKPNQKLTELLLNEINYEFDIFIETKQSHQKQNLQLCAENKAVLSGHVRTKLRGLLLTSF